MRWNENDTYKFVQIYLQQELLWNPEHPYYKNKLQRQLCYQKVISKFKDATNIFLNETEAKIKIRNLRSTYLQTLHKIVEKTTLKYIYQPTLKWFEIWHECFKGDPRKKINTTNSKEIDSVFEDCEMLEESDERSWADEIKGEHIDTSTKDDSADHSGYNTDTIDGNCGMVDNNYVLIVKPDLQQQSDPPVLAPSSDIKSYKIKKKKIRHNRDLYKKPVRTCMEPSTEPHTKDDEFDIFGKFIASQLRNMELQQALRIQLDIQSLVSEARISEISANRQT